MPSKTRSPAVIAEVGGKAGLARLAQRSDPRSQKAVMAVVVMDRIVRQRSKRRIIMGRELL